MSSLPTYQRVYANRQVVAYASADARHDHLFLYAATDPGAEPETVGLPQLVERWSQARPLTRDGRAPVPRTVFFCQQFTLSTLPAVLDKLDIPQHWGKAAYWSSDDFRGGTPDDVFPNGTPAPFAIGELSVLWRGPQPSTLDDFVIELDEKNRQLLLGLPSGTSCRIRRAGTEIATSTRVALPLVAPNGFVAGAVNLAVEWPTNRTANHPLRAVGFVFEGQPELLPSPGEDPVPCPTWRAELGDEVDHASDERCLLALDVRDGPSVAQWLAGDLNSRLHFGQATLRSSLFGTKGQRLHLRAVDGVARLGFVFDRMHHDGSVESLGEAIFHPEGAFEIVNPGLAAGDQSNGIGALDVIAGSAATEFFDLAGSNVRRLRFSTGPAFLENSPQLLGNKQVPGERKGRVITSFVEFTDAADTPIGVQFHSQPARSALFAASDETDHLSRRRAALGAATVPMPTFPWAGHRRNGGAATVEAARPDFEVTHLSKWRRQHVTRGLTRRVLDSAGTRGVTPQGVLAEVTTDGYARLFFGNSDSANSLQAEFSIGVKASPIFSEVQQALAASQLFLVFDRPSEQALETLKPDVKMFIRDFRFTVKVEAQVGARAAEPDRTVLLVKYFTGKSLQDLVADPTLWALRNHLAGAATPAAIETLLHLDANPELPIPEPLQTDVWRNPEWQGVLALHLAIDAMPPILESLEPGIVGSLVVHHFGLTAPPIRRGDLSSTEPRLGSAFGLIHYAKPAKDPDPPKTNDEEPGATGPGDRKYRFVVNSLDVGFQNSQISRFGAEVGIEFDHLFWDRSSVHRALLGRRPRLPADTAGGTTLTLIGSYERRVKPNGGTEDVFSLRAEHEYTVTFDADSRLESFTIRRAQLSIVSSEREPGGGTQPLRTLTAFIGIDGDLKLSEDHKTIPLFKVKAIHLKDFGFEFVYTPKGDPRFAFGFKAEGVAADLEFDPPAGSSSLMGLLPVKLKGMSIAIGKLFELGDLGFQPVTFGGIGSAFQFGFVLELDLGFLGRLAGEMRGLRVPMLLGWRGGSQKGVAFGIQFPTFDGKIDIGIQQFIRLRAEHLNLVPCPAPGTNLQAIAIQAVNAKVIMLGREWPDAETSFTFFVPVHASRRASWALGVKPQNSWLKYLGGGQRIKLPAADPTVTGTKEIVQQFEDHLGEVSQVCGLLGAPEADGWSLVARFEAGVQVWLAVDDARQTYGLVLMIPVLGEIDVLYRRINDQLGIFSAEYTLPEAIRTIQIGAASLRLPTFRIEVHTDGGALFDFGFPWRNDFSRSCQLEIAIFVGSGGFYYGRTSAAASALLDFEGGYGFSRPDSAQLTRFRALRLGFALRVGIGRSFSIGILSAEASLTIFGGLEGAAAYPDGGGDLLAPTLYALRGFVGLMLDIRAEVNFAIIKARARLLAYVMVGLEVRRVLAKKDGTHHLVKLPTVLFAEVGLTVEVEVEISIGCVSIRIHLSFSATWRLEETIGSLEHVPLFAALDAVPSRAVALPVRPDWNTNYRFWTGQRDLHLFVTVLPCMARASDVGLPGDLQTCVVGQMLLPILPDANAFGDFAKFLTGWIVRPDTTTGIPDGEQITLKTISALRLAIKNGGEHFWDGFQAALATVVDAQFNPIFNALSTGHKEDPFAALPLWPGTIFRARETKSRSTRSTSPQFVAERGEVLRGDEAGFANYSSCIILGLLAEIEQLITDEGQSPDSAGDSPRNDPEKFLTWGDIWTRLFADLTAVGQ